MPRERTWQHLGFTSPYPVSITFLDGSVYAGASDNLVYRLQDDGKTKVTLGAGFPRERASALVTAGGAVYAGTGQGVFRLRPGGEPWARTSRTSSSTRLHAFDSALYVVETAAPQGSLRSDDGGESWVRVADAWIEHVVRFGDALYAVGSHEDRTLGSTLMRSRDGGYTWEAVGPVVGRFDLVVASGVFYVATGPGGVYRSADVGASWQPVNHGLATLRTYALATDGADLYANTWEGGVYRASLTPRPSPDATSAERRVDYQIPVGMSLYSTPLHATRVGTEARNIDIMRVGGALMAHHLIQLGSSVVISLDSGQFRTAIGRDGVMVFGEDFPIEPSRGYVVNALSPINVTMDGYPHGAVIEAPEGPSTPGAGAWGFVVAGHVEGATTLPMGARLRVANARTGQATLTAVGAGREFAVPLTDLTRGEVVVEGDVLRLQLLSRDGFVLGRASQTRVGPAELRQANVLLSLSARPDAGRLLPNYPNPFNPETWIPFQVADPSTMIVTIYDPRGRAVRTVDLGVVDSGFHVDRGDAVRWDGRNDAGETVGSGVYHVEMRAGDAHDVRRIAIAR
ncbi:hypothetical protein CMK11_00380 [Candidatus Poribacteria bacterium]|nr:hypothetical protein [Candidatus Poribacteria bacterium]